MGHRTREIRTDKGPSAVTRREADQSRPGVAVPPRRTERRGDRARRPRPTPVPRPSRRRHRQMYPRSRRPSLECHDEAKALFTESEYRNTSGRRSSVGRAPGCYPGCPRFETWRRRFFPRQRAQLRLGATEREVIAGTQVSSRRDAAERAPRVKDRLDSFETWRQCLLCPRAPSFIWARPTTANCERTAG